MREIKFRAWDEKGKDMIYSGAKKICYQIEDVKKHTKAFIEKLKDLLKDGDYYGDRSFTDLFKRIDKTAEEEFGDKILK